MNIEEKQKRLEHLQNQEKNGFLSDDEYDEKEKLEQEFELEENETTEFKPSIGIKETISVPKKKKRSIAEILIERLRSKPATYKEIEQLKLEREKAILKRDISIAKSQTPSKMSKVLNSLSTFNNPKSRKRKNHII